MNPQNALTFIPGRHPDPRVVRVGFDLTHPYVQCWGPVIGPSATSLVRRLPVLWAEATPATVTRADLARSLGLGDGTGPNSRLIRALDRTVRFGLARWNDAGQSVEVFYRIPALTPRQLERLPDWTQRAHQRLIDSHLQAIQTPTELKPASDTSDQAARAPRTHSERSDQPDPRQPAMSLRRRHGHPGSPASAPAHVCSETHIRRAHICRFPFGKPAVARPRTGS